MIHYQSVRDPIEYVVDEYFKKKRLVFVQSEGTDSASSHAFDSSTADNQLAELPVTIFRNDEGTAYKFVYGNINALTSDEEADPILWMEELIRDDEGKMTAYKTTYPDGAEVINDFVKNTDGKLEKVE